MNLFEKIQATLPEGTVHDVCIGLNWTAMVVDVGGQLQCGLASTMPGIHEHTGESAIPLAGQLVGRSTSELLAETPSWDSSRMSLAMATLNASLPRYSESWTERNAVDLIATQGDGKRVALVGHFPFVDVLRSKIPHLDVLDYNPLEGDLPAEAAPLVLPKAEFVAITGLTLLNGTFESLLEMCSPNAILMMLGPTTPLTPLMYDYGIDILAGTVVVDIDVVMRVVAQGGNFRQIRRTGTRPVTQVVMTGS